MTLRNVTSPRRQVAFMIRLPTGLPPDRSPKPFLFACEEVSLNRLSPMPRRKSAPARPRTGNRRNPLLHQAIIDAAAEVLAKEGPTRFTIEAVAKLAGCGKPTIYRWWPSRPALLLEVYEQAAKQEVVEPEGKDLAKDLATMLRQVFRFWREGCMGSLFHLILSEMMLEKEGARYLREVFIPRRQAFTAIPFQAAVNRGEIPPETDIKLLQDLLYGYSLFCMITGQLDDDQIPERIGATIAKLACSGVLNPVRSDLSLNSLERSGTASEKHVMIQSQQLNHPSSFLPRLRFGVDLSSGV
jgi:AcrR family transcriptional regulator